MFETDKSLLLIPKDKSESNRFYYLKCLFLSQKDLTKKNYEHYINLANCYANNKINGCIYSDSIMNALNN